MKIWAFALPPPRKITLRAIVDDTQDRSEFLLRLSKDCNRFLARVNPNSPVTLLHVNNESRLETLKTYQPAFKIECDRPIYVDLVRDVALCKEHDANAFVINRGFIASSKSEAAPIQTFAIKLTQCDCERQPSTRVCYHTVSSMQYRARWYIEYFIEHFDWNLRTIIIVHEHWNEEFGKYGTKACFNDICSSDNMPENFQEDFKKKHGVSFSISVMPQVVHMAEHDFNHHYQ